MKNLSEKVAVVARDLIFENSYWQGLKIEKLNYYLDLIKNNYQFRPRSEVEEDLSWKQIIPYIIFSFQDKYFLYRYLDKASEQRLRQDFILGIGGHINPIDLKPREDILEVAAMREWREEINYQGNLLDKKLVGILNDEGRMVEAVHLGLVYHFVGDSPKIFAKEKSKIAGKLVKLKDLENYLKNSGGWAPIVYREYLTKFLK